MSDRERRDVHVDVIRNVRRVDPHVDLVHDLLENTAGVLHAVGRADEAQRNADDDLLAGHELLEIDVEDRAPDRIALQLSNERPRRLAVERELDDRASDSDALREAIEVTRV